MSDTQATLVGLQVPDFSAPSTAGDFVLSHRRGQIVVVYFYPKDNTPGCTQESRDFALAYERFRAAGAVVVGVSRDSLASHERFRAAFELPFELISDADETVCTMFGVIKDKKMYGKTVRGIERSTFVIDAAGVVRHAWRGVKVAGHVEDVLAAVHALS